MFLCSLWGLGNKHELLTDLQTMLFTERFPSLKEMTSNVNKMNNQEELVSEMHSHTCNKEKSGGEREKNGQIFR